MGAVHRRRRRPWLLEREVARVASRRDCTYYRGVPSDFDKTMTELYRAPLESFVAERTRLAGELKAAGHQSDATRLAKAGRPSISAWAVNQLWWHARPDFDELLETAAQLRKGKLAASGAHRKALTKLTARAHKLLGESGHGTADATLRRVSVTLSALAAAGGFEPELPGTLSKDRDPPGFEAFGIASADEATGAETEPKAERHAPKAASQHEPKSNPTPKSKAHEKQQRDEVKRRAAAAAQKEREAARKLAAKERQAAAAEHARVAEERAKKHAKRRELEAVVQGAKKELTQAERQLERAQTALGEAQAALAQLGRDD